VLLFQEKNKCSSHPCNVFFQITVMFWCPPPVLKRPASPFVKRPASPFVASGGVVKRPATPFKKYHGLVIYRRFSAHLAEGLEVCFLFDMFSLAVSEVSIIINFFGCVLCCLWRSCAAMCLPFHFLV